MLRAVIFDMDGVLVDSEIHWKQVESEFLIGLVPGWNESLQQSILGMSAYDVHALLVREHGVELTPEEFVGYYTKLSSEIYGVKSNLIEGARAALDRVKELRLTIGLASSSPHGWIKIVLQRFELANYFAAVISSDDLEGRGKPAPEIYAKAAASVGCEANECVAIEDTAKGVQSAKSAGLRCIGFRNGFNKTQDLSAADTIIAGFHELDADLLLSLYCSLRFCKFPD